MEDALVDTNSPCFWQPPGAFSVIFGNVPKQSEISKIFGNRICRSPRRGLIRNQFVSSSCYGLRTNTFNEHLHGNRRLSVIFFSIIIAVSTARNTTVQDSQLCFYDSLFSLVVVASVILTFKLKLIIMKGVAVVRTTTVVLSWLAFLLIPLLL